MRTFWFLLFLTCLCTSPFTLRAAVEIRPFFIDVTLQPRESYTEEIKLTSDYPVRNAVLFATVNEITVGVDGEVKEFEPPVATDRTNTVTSWINVSRGQIVLSPNEEIFVPITITAHPFAEPGEYHVFVGFVETKKRDDAEAIALAGRADGVVVKVTVEDQRSDTMRITSTHIDRFVTNPDNQQLEITIQNAGDIPSAPKGELIFYDRRGREVATAAMNTNSIVIPSGASETFSVDVPLRDTVGRFKTNVNLRYGQDMQASLFDSVTFLLMPPWVLAIIGVSILVLVVLLTVLLRRAFGSPETSEHGDDVLLFVRDGHDGESTDHDIDLKNNT